MVRRREWLRRPSFHARPSGFHAAGSRRRKENSLLAEKMWSLCIVLCSHSHACGRSHPVEFAHVQRGFVKGACNELMHVHERICFFFNSQSQPNRQPAGQPV